MTVENEIKQFVERIERLKDEIDALNGDIREIYAEAKARGLDKTALGDVVSIRRKRAKNPEAFEERSAIVELYLAAAEGRPSRTHAHAREATEVSPHPAVSPAAQSEGAGKQGTDCDAQKADGCNPQSDGAAKAEMFISRSVQFVTATRAAEGVAAPVETAPVPDAPKRQEIDLTIPAHLDRRKSKPIIDELVP